VATQPAEVATELLETMLFTPEGGVFLLLGHLHRMCCSAVALGFHCPSERQISEVLERASLNWPAAPQRVRLLLSPGGECRVEHTPLAPIMQQPRPHMPILKEIAKNGANGLRVRLDPEWTPSGHAQLRHKTTSRQVYDDARVRAGVGANGIEDVLMHNEAGEITECSIANIALEEPSGLWITPHRDCGLLPGVMRAELIRLDQILERTILLNELQLAMHAGRRLVAFNSVRGVFAVTLVI